MAYQLKYNPENLRGSMGNYAKLQSGQFKKHYAKIYQGDALEDKIKLHAIYHYAISILENKKNKLKVKDVHNEMIELGMGVVEDYNYFSRLLKLMRKKDIESFLIHGCKGVKREHLSKFLPELVDVADVAFAENQIGYPQILEIVNKEARLLGLDEISIHHLKRYFADPEVQNRLRPVRNGEDWYRDNLGEVIHFKPLKNSGSVFEIDGSRLQIPYYDELTKSMKFLCLFVILDKLSKMILGYSLDKSENSRMVKRAFLRFFEYFDFLPVQIVRDDSSGFKKEFKHIQSVMEMKGVDWKVTSDPRAKSHVEAFFKIFCNSICTSIPHYIGLGITTKHIDSRYSPKQLKKRISDITLLPTKTELIELIDRLIQEYNHIKFGAKISAYDSFYSHFNQKELIQLDFHDKMLLTKERRYSTVKNKELEFEYNKESYYYRISHNLGEKHLNRQLVIVFDEIDMSKAWVFDRDFNFITEAELLEKHNSIFGQQSSTEKARIIQKVRARKKKFKEYERAVVEKKKMIEERREGVVAMFDYNFNKTKEEQIAIQNAYTRKMMQKDIEDSSEEENDLPRNDPFFKVDRAKFN
jgi:transposase InsO family protein